jgi:hypothetical protein
MDSQKMSSLENKCQAYLCLRALAVSIQDGSRHHVFKPGNIWFLATKGESQMVKTIQNVMPIWEIVNGTSEAFQEVFNNHPSIFFLNET